MALVRVAEKKDIPAIAELGRKLLEFEFQFDDLLAPCSLPRMKAYYSRRLKNKNARMFVAAEKGRIIGFSLGSIEKTKIMTEKNIGYYDDCFVEEEHRKKGVAQELSGALFAWFKSKGIGHVKISAYTDNKAAVDAWKKIGFKDMLVNLRMKI
jgi:GNAT superfamily N-acetyltransferase